MSKRHLTAVAAALLSGAIAAGVSYATIPGAGNVYSACMLKGVGTIRLIDKSLPESNLMSRCKPSLELEVSWNQAGQQGSVGPRGAAGASGADGAPGANGEDGQDGVSVTSDAEPAGANCSHGGSRFTAANGVTYACSGPPGTGSGLGWNLSGNASTNPESDYIGTSDNQPLDLRVNGMRALRLDPPTNIGFPDSPNVIGGFSGNSVDPDVSGASIGGGGLNGFVNNVYGPFGTVAGGYNNKANALASVVGGSANIASGGASIVAGGERNTASGQFSFVGGRFGSATHTGAFVWADNHATWGFGSTAANEFSVRARGGVRFVSGIDGSGNPNAGVSLAPGSGSWSSLSDRALKRGFASVNGSWVLGRIATLPISTWSYKAQTPSVRHLGPTAQEFRRAFGLGVDERHIDSIDSEGVSLAGVKALYELARSQQREIDALKRQVARLQHS